MAEAGLVADHEAFAGLAADLLGADIGPGRAADLDRAVRAGSRAAGDPLGPEALATRLRTAPPGDPVRRAFVEALTISETHFFRLQGQFDALAERVLPALLAVFGRAVFWPARPKVVAAPREGWWARIAGVCINRPWATLVAGVALFVAVPAAVLREENNPLALMDACRDVRMSLMVRPGRSPTAPLNGAPQTPSGSPRRPDQ